LRGELLGLYRKAPDSSKHKDEDGGEAKGGGNGAGPGLFAEEHGDYADTIGDDRAKNIPLCAGAGRVFPPAGSGHLLQVYVGRAPTIPAMAKEPVFEYKQCIVIRNDVKMSCGKRCAQAGHAAIGAYNGADKSLQKAWLAEGQKKVVLKANDERTLFEIKVIAERAGISTSLIQDAGMTEIPPGTITALGLGPAKTSDLDKITGSLSLL
jgi:PTH2 family peptidyl-tRNA hydrolase